MHPLELYILHWRKKNQNDTLNYIGDYFVCVQAVYKLKIEQRHPFERWKLFQMSKTDVLIVSTPQSIITHIVFENGSRDENDGHILYKSCIV